MVSFGEVKTEASHSGFFQQKTNKTKNVFHKIFVRRSFFPSQFTNKAYGISFKPFRSSRWSFTFCENGGASSFFSRLGVLMYWVIKGVCRSFFSGEGRISYQKIQFLVSFTSLCGDKPSVVVLRFSTFRYNHKERPWKSPDVPLVTLKTHGSATELFFKPRARHHKWSSSVAPPLFPASRSPSPFDSLELMNTRWARVIHPQSIHQAFILAASCWISRGEINTILNSPFFECHKKECSKNPRKKKIPLLVIVKSTKTNFGILSKQAPSRWQRTHNHTRLSLLPQSP